MRRLDDKLKNKKLEIDKLLSYGFIKDNNNFIYEKEILDNNFKIIVNVTNELVMTSRLVEIATDDEYLLADISNPTGNFIGKIKEEYDNILQDIINNCTTMDVFKSEYSKEIIKYIREKYNDDLEFLWKKFENNAIWRNKQNNKWYGALLIISESKLDNHSDKIIEIIDLRYQKESIKDIIDNKKIFPGYHMNKNNWITIKLDGSVKIEDIFKLIDNSYNISLKNK